MFLLHHHRYHANRLQYIFLSLPTGCQETRRYSHSLCILNGVHHPQLSLYMCLPTTAAGGLPYTHSETKYKNMASIPPLLSVLLHLQCHVVVTRCIYESPWPLVYSKYTCTFILPQENGGYYAEWYMYYCWHSCRQQ